MHRESASRAASRDGLGAVFQQPFMQLRFSLTNQDLIETSHFNFVSREFFVAEIPTMKAREWQAAELGLWEGSVASEGGLGGGEGVGCVVLAISKNW